MELFIIRHAQSHNNSLTDQSDRVVDPSLTELGRRQAELVADYVASGDDQESITYAGFESTPSVRGPGLGITRLYCSAMLRALETAQAIGRAIGQQPHVWLDIHEQGGMWLDHGEPEGIVGYPGMTRKEIIRQFPECVLPDEISDEGWWRYRQEEDEHFRCRAGTVAAALREMAAKGAADHIAIVTHGGFGAELLKAILGVPPTAQIFFHHDNTGITRVRFRANGTISVRYQNRLKHLPAELVT